MLTWVIWFLIILIIFVADLYKEDYILTDYYEDFFYTLLVLFAVFFAGFRYQIGNDYDSYASIYQSISADPLSTYVEPGFAYFCFFLSWLGISEQGMFLVFSATTIILLAKTLKKYSVNPLVSFMIFLFLPGYYWNTLSIVRQFFAMAIIFYGVKYIINREFLKYLLCVIIATVFHKTAVIMIPLYYLVQLNFSRFILLAGLIIVIIFPLTSYLEGNILLTDYEDYFTSDKPEFSLATSLITKLAIFFIVLFYKDRFEDNESKIIINIYLLGVVFYFATLATEAISRISLYMTIFEIIAIVKIFDLFLLKDRIQLHALYLTYCVLFFFNQLRVYETGYVKGTSIGNIEYKMNFKVWK
ncbi:MAG TPA: EpsG family protein [Sphingobacteriaceae bacterium]|nr:EpsG family protein [Sphingobacteriaceae bacterium]